MSTLTIEVRTFRESLANVVQVMGELIPEEPTVSFDSPELLWKVLTAKRWEILKIMTGKGPLALREVARLTHRDVKSVHADIHALLDAGIVDRVSKGFVFPHDAIHVDFLLKAG